MASWGPDGGRAYAKLWDVRDGRREPKGRKVALVSRGPLRLLGE